MLFHPKYHRHPVVLLLYSLFWKNAPCSINSYRLSPCSVHSRVAVWHIAFAYHELCFPQSNQSREFYAVQFHLLQSICLIDPIQPACFNCYPPTGFSIKLFSEKCPGATAYLISDTVWICRPTYTEKIDNGNKWGLSNKQHSIWYAFRIRRDQLIESDERRTSCSKPPSVSVCRAPNRADRFTEPKASDKKGNSPDQV